MKNHVKPLYCLGTPVLPAVYGESLSYMEVQGKMQYNINQMIENQEDFDERLGECEETVAGFEERVSALEEGLGTAEDDIDALEDRMGTAEGDIDGLEDRMGTAEGDIDSLEGRMDTAEGDIDSLEGHVQGNDLGTSVPKYDVEFTDHTYTASNGSADGTITITQDAYYVPNNSGEHSQQIPAVSFTPKVGGWDALVASIPKNYVDTILGITVSDGGSEVVSSFEFYNNASSVSWIISVSLSYDVRRTGSVGTVTVNVRIDGADNEFEFDYGVDGDRVESIIVPYVATGSTLNPNALVGNHVAEIIVSASGCSLS